MDKAVNKNNERLAYANLNVEQEKNLRKLEHSFNNEYDTDFYFMVMKKE